MYNFQNEKVRLRAITPSDLDNYVRWFSDTEVQRTLQLYKPQSREGEQRWIDSITSGDNPDTVYAIEAIDGTAPLHIGSCAIHHPDWRNANCEIGIAIGEKTHWGKGYGPAALELLLEHAFGQFNMHMVYLRVYAFNQRGQGAYQKLGFKLDGRLRQAFYREGAYHDVLYMSILRNEWEQKQTPPHQP